ncbi:4-hydroxy-tetrahydrodipicolinate reductase [Nocardioidaceae bacterium SCSIO 66511]|nr:4-hydroxy-tetrahydrodipicolinate reductase [Nocardioidaceae bacterium SCSIO 66511]
MTNVCFAGVTGWTAPPILAGIDAADDLALTAGVSRSAAGQSLRSATGHGDGQVYASVAEALATESVDVLVDYTSAAAVKQNVDAAVDAGVHVVVGSSGLTSADYAVIDDRARAQGVGIFAAGNFSVLAAVLRRSASLAAEKIDSWEIFDFASDTKPDVPSGTARELAETLAEVRRPELGVPIEDLEGPAEARGADIAGTRVHSVRLPSYVVGAEVVFAAGGERLSMKFDPGTSPDLYAEGTILAIRRVSEVAGVRRGLDALLFD